MKTGKHSLPVVLFLFAIFAHPLLPAHAQSSGKIHALIEKLADADADSSQQAYSDIVKIGKPAVPYLDEALKDKRKNVRWLAVQALGAIGGKDVLPSLILALTDKDKDVRRYAATFLGRWGKGEKDAVNALKKGLLDSNPEVVWHAMGALEELGETNYKSNAAVVKKLIKHLKSSDGEIIMNAVMALEKTGNSLACKPLVKALAYPAPSMMCRRTAAEAIAKIGCPAAVPSLLKLFNDKSKGKDIRTAAALALKSIGDKGLNDSALPLVESKEEWLRETAIDMLGFENNTQATAKLVQVMEDKKEQLYIRYKAVVSLGEIRDPAAVDSLGKILKDKDDMLKREAVWALGKTGTAGAAPYLIEALDDSGTLVVSVAAYHLGLMKTKDAIEPIYKLLFREDALDCICSNPALCPLAIAAHNALVAITQEKLAGHVFDKKGLKKIRGQWGKKLGFAKK